MEFCKYRKDLLEENGCGHIKLCGGGGGTILPGEIQELHQYGITRIYSPDDGRRMGLEGMIEDVIQHCDFPLNGNPAHLKGELKLGEWMDIRKIARAISNAENGVGGTDRQAEAPGQGSGGEAGQTGVAGSPEAGAGTAMRSPVLGITGTGGAWKSSVKDEIVRRYLNIFTEKPIAVSSVDPYKKKTGGALLGDRIRMNSISGPRSYMRSLATRDSDKALSAHVQDAIDICKEAGYDLIILESAGVGQSDASILDHADLSLYVMTPEYGAASQLEKINMLDYADLIVLNKFDKAGALDALHDIRKQYKRNHGLWNAKDGELPIVGTIAAQFNDAGVNELFEKLMGSIAQKTGIHFGPVETHVHTQDTKTQSPIIPPSRVRYLSEISGGIREYDQRTEEQAALASKWYQLDGVLRDLPPEFPGRPQLEEQKEKLEKQLLPVCKKLIGEWESVKARYRQEFFEYHVRGKSIRQPLYIESLSHLHIPRISVPRYRDWGDILRWRLQANFPG